MPKKKAKPEEKETSVKHPDDDKSIRDIAKEGIEEDKSEEKPPKEEKPSKEKPKEEKKEEKKDELSVPLKEVEKEIEKKAKEEIKADVLRSIGITKEDEKVAKKEGYKTPWEKRGEAKPKSWREALEAGSELTEFKRTKREEKQKEKADTDAKGVEERNKLRNQRWDSQLEYLRSKDYIPRVNPDIDKKLKKGESITDDEAKDPGLAAQATLIETMYRVGVARDKNKQEPIMDLIHIYHEYYEKGKQPAGATAPISGGKRGVEGEPKEEKYEDIKGKSFEDIARGE